MTKKVATYYRTTEKSKTYEEQKEELEKLIKRQGWELVEEYKDLGVYSHDPKPALEELKKDIIRKKFDMLAVWSADRLGNNSCELIRLLTDAQHQNIGVHICKHDFDTSTPTGIAILQMMFIFLDFDREMFQCPD